MRFSVTKPTPRNMRYVQCQACGFRCHVKDVVKISDRYNKWYGLIVCKDHSNKTNPQTIPAKPKEQLVGYLDKINPIRYGFISNPNDDRAPGPPTDGMAYYEKLNGNLTLKWNAPLDNGSSPIKGYAIKYANTQRSYYQVLIENTGSEIPVFIDTTNNIADYVSYQVAAINGYGQGPYSDEFYWPIDVFANNLLHGSNYLTMENSQGNYDFVVVAGSYVLLS